MKVTTASKTFLLAICASFFFTHQSSASNLNKKESKVLAEVNGISITGADFAREVKNLPDYLKAMAETPQGRKEMLDTMVIRELILQRAAKDGIDKDKDVEDRLLELKKRVIVEIFLKKAVESKVRFSDADLKEFYERNTDKFKTGKQIKASHILVKSKKEASEILAKIKAGGNFEELAKKSLDVSSAKGGDLGWFGEGSMVPAFEEAAIALKVGQVSGVVESEFGFHIIKLTGIRAPGVRPFEEVQEEIRGALTSSRQQEEFIKIKEELRKNAKIIIKDEAGGDVDEVETKSDGKKPVVPLK